MDLADKIRARIQSTPLGSQARNTLRSILGELLAKDACHKGDTFLRDWIRGNEDNRWRFRRDDRLWQELERLDDETRILKSLLE